MHEAAGTDYTECRACAGPERPTDPLSELACVGGRLNKTPAGFWAAANLPPTPDLTLCSLMIPCEARLGG